MMALGMRSAQTVTAAPWTMHTNTEAILVQRAIFLRPPSSSEIFFSLGKTISMSCMMIWVEM
jgi:hypothetical protein